MTQAQTIDKETRVAAEEFEALPKSESCRLINFESAEVVPCPVGNGYILVVKGEAPYLNMQVDLFPLVYVQQPKYWVIEVAGCIPGGIGLPATKPYTVTLPLGGGLGSEGITVVGANGSKSFKV